MRHGVTDIFKLIYFFVKVFGYLAALVGVILIATLVLSMIDPSLASGKVGHGNLDRALVFLVSIVCVSLGIAIIKSK